MRRLLAPPTQQTQPQPSPTGSSQQTQKPPDKTGWSIRPAMSSGVLGEANRNTQQRGISGIGDIAKTFVGDIAKTAIQMPRAFAAGVAGLTGNEKAQAEFSKPVNVPILGEVKGLSAKPSDIKQYGTQTAEETAGQALSMGTELATFTGVPGMKALPEGANLTQQVIHGAETGAAFGAAGSASQAMKKNESVKDVSGETIKGGLVGGIAGGTVPLAVAGAKAVASKMSRIAVNRMIKPIASHFKFGKDPVGAFIEEGFQGNNIHEIADQVATRKNEVGASIDEVIQKVEQTDPSKTLNLKDVVDSVDEQIKKSAYSPDDIAELKRIRGMLTDIRDVQGGESVVTGQRNIESLKPSEVQQIKRIVGDNASWTAKASDKVNSFAKRLYGMLDGKIDEAVPEAADLNNRYGELLSLNKATQRAIEQKAAKEGRGDTTDIMSGVSAVGALFAGDFKLAGSIVGADILRKLVDSPAVASRLSVLMQRASDTDLAQISQKYPDFANVLKTMGRAGLAAIAQKATEQPKRRARKSNG